MKLTKSDQSLTHKSAKCLSAFSNSMQTETDYWTLLLMIIGPRRFEVLFIPLVPHGLSFHSSYATEAWWITDAGFNAAEYQYIKPREIYCWPDEGLPSNLRRSVDRSNVGCHLELQPDGFQLVTVANRECREKAEAEAAPCLTRQ